MKAPIKYPLIPKAWVESQKPLDFYQIWVIRKDDTDWMTAGREASLIEARRQATAKVMDGDNSYDAVCITYETVIDCPTCGMGDHRVVRGCGMWLMQHDAPVEQATQSDTEK